MCESGQLRDGVVQFWAILGPDIVHIWAIRPTLGQCRPISQSSVLSNHRNTSMMFQRGCGKGAQRTMGDKLCSLWKRALLSQCSSLNGVHAESGDAGRSSPARGPHLATSARARVEISPNPSDSGPVWLGSGRARPTFDRVRKEFDPILGKIDDIGARADFDRSRASVEQHRPSSAGRQPKLSRFPQDGGGLRPDPAGSSRSPSEE